ncbi:MAG: winged helix DNA-binding protein [Actinomycetia bacterium]|nr:winged helix DNA-binding protein [Actinomycetes bacterium]
MSTPEYLPPARRSGHLPTDLRLVCMRISRRNRFESQTDVPPHLFGVLAGIEQGASNAAELCERERVGAPTMSRAIAALAEAGWIERTDDPDDGRRTLLALTPEGTQTLATIRAARDEWMARRLEPLSAEEIATLEAALPILDRLAQS